MPFVLKKVLHPIVSMLNVPLYLIIKLICYFIKLAELYVLKKLLSATS